MISSYEIAVQLWASPQNINMDGSERNIYDAQMEQVNTLGHQPYFILPSYLRSPVTRGPPAGKYSPHVLSVLCFRRLIVHCEIEVLLYTEMKGHVFIGFYQIL